ncbi:MAG: DUF4623 domain-containing protein [Ignavibacteriaceae bacterium]|nr:DUF4623 domain-containing protein [Ignavibacteriaceae bacterium]
MSKVLLSQKRMKFFTSILMMVMLTLLFSTTSFAQISTLWQKSTATANKPAWFGTDTERGFGYGLVGGQQRLYVVSRNGATNIIILDALTGDSVGVLSTTGIAGGLFTLNDVEVSSDGVIYASNLTTSTGTAAYNVYSWANEAANPVLVASYNVGTYRLGDKLTVTGSNSDNSVTIYAVAASSTDIVKFTTADNGASFTATPVTVTGLTSGTTPCVAVGPANYYVNGNGQLITQVDLSNTLIGKVDANLIPTNSNAIKYFGSGASQYVAAYLYGPGTTITSTASFWERVQIVDVTGGYTSAGIVASTPALGTSTNTNGAGDVSIKDNGDGTFTIFTLSTNNGVGAYTFTPASASAVLTPPFTQNFAAFYPPANWMRYNGLLTDPVVLTSTTSGWIPDDFGNVTTTLDRSARVNIYGTFAKYWLVTPTINLGDGSTDYQFEFDMALTDYGNSNPPDPVVGDDDKFAVLISVDNGLTWSAASALQIWDNTTTPALAAIPNTGQHITLSLAAYSGNVKIAFYGESTVSNGDNDLSVDNVQVREIPANPIFSVTPDSKDFGGLQIGSTSTEQVFTVSNTGAGTLTVSSTALVSNDSSFFTLTDVNTYPVSLTVGQSMTVSVAFNPTTVGAKSATLRFGANVLDADHDAALTGTGMDYTISSFPYTQGFEAGVVPPDGWLNTNGFWNRGTEAHSGSYAARVSYNFSSTLNAYLQTPPVVLPAAPRISFWWKDDDITAGKSENDIEEMDKKAAGGGEITPAIALHDSTFFEISSDNGATWTTLAVLSAASSMSAYEEVILDLSPYGSSTVVMRWRDKTDASFSAYGTGLDDITIEEIPAVQADWNNLQWPGTATITAGSNATAYAQIYEAGLTDVTVGGAAPGIQAWFGVSNANTNPNTWTTWVPATFNVESGNNDEYMADFGSTLAPGTYYYASRFQIQTGPYTYGGFSGGGGGFWDGTNNVSGVLTVNPYTVNTFPYTEGFENTSFPPAGWAVENVNASNTWIRSTLKPNTGVASAAYYYSSTTAADDWLLSPAVTLTAGKTYSVTYYYATASSSYPEKLNVYVGHAQNAAGMDSMLADHPALNNTTYMSQTITYAPATTGVFYFGFHCYSIADEWNLYLDDITVNEMQDNDYALSGLYQVDGIPTPYKMNNVTSLFEKGVDPYVTFNREGLTPVHSSNVNNSIAVINPINSIRNGNNEKLGGTVNLKALVSNVGLLSPAYQVNFWINGVAGIPYSTAVGVPFGGTDTVSIADIVAGRGTFTTVATVVAAGDSMTSNDTLAFYRTLVYPDSTIRLHYDNGPNVPSTFIGFGTNYIPATAGVRFTAANDMQLANIDAFYRNESSSDSILVTVWAAGTDSLAPGIPLYTKKFAGENYVVPGTVGAYVTLPLGDDAPVMMAGTDFWVSVTFDSLILYPMGAHNSPLSTPGRSFIYDGTGWFPLVITTERAWLLRVVGIPYTAPPVLTTWERSAANATLPSWFTTSNTERGVAHGRVMSEAKSLVDRVFVVSRNGGLFVKVLDGLTGADLGELNTTGVTGGLFALNDVEVSADGKVFACNMTTNASTAGFKVYMWDSLTAVPAVVVDYTASEVVRLGDKFSVAFNYNDNTAAIFAASATTGIGKVFKWTMTSGSFNAAPEIIVLSDNAAGGSASVGPIWGGSFYWNAGGQSARKYAADGTLLGTVPGTVVATGSNAIKFIGTVNGSEYFATYQYGGGNENARIVEVPNGDLSSATTYGLTTTLGANANAGGTGDVDIMVNPDGTAFIYVLSTNNGVGVYKSSAQIPVELESFAGTVEDRNVILNWQTATETNTSMFQIERTTGSSWEVVGSIRAAGTSTEKKTYTFIDKDLNSGKYQYRLKMVDLDGTYTYSATTEVEVGVPTVFSLSQNYPNPFNPTTRVDYQIPANSRVTIELYDITGQKVAELLNREQSAGYYTLDISANKHKLASGVYIYRMIAVDNTSGKNFVNTKKMMLLK